MLHTENLPAVQSEYHGSLVRASLDIGRVLADRDGVTFRAQGTCMYPTIRPGDVLRIQPRTAAQVAVGEIAVCRRPGYLFSHRVIATGQQAGQAFIVNRPDRSVEGSDNPIFDKDLLGVVIEIKRKGRQVPLSQLDNPYLARCYYALHLSLLEVAPRLLVWFSNVLAGPQSTRQYGWLARGWLAMMRPAITYTVRVPLNANLGPAVYRQFAPGEFDPQTAWQGRHIERWTLNLFLNAAHEPAGWITLVRDNAGAWQIEKGHIRVRYRGMGFQSALQKQAQKILAGCGNA